MKKSYDISLRDWLRFRARGFTFKETPCPGCGGEGKIKEQECKWCEGTGITSLIKLTDPQRRELEKFIKERKWSL